MSWRRKIVIKLLTVWSQLLDFYKLFVGQVGEIIKTFK